MAHRLTRARDSQRATAPTNDDEDNVALQRRTYLGLLSAAVAMLLGSSRSTASTASGPNEFGRYILIRGGDGVSRYKVTVAGALAASDENGDVRISGSSAEGVVTDGDRRYQFDGEIRDLAVEGSAEVRVGTAR